MNIKKWILGALLLVGAAGTKIRASEAPRVSTENVEVSPAQKFIAGAILISFLWHHIHDPLDRWIPHKDIKDPNTKWFVEKGKSALSALLTGAAVYFAGPTFLIPIGQWLFNSFKATPYKGVMFC